MYKARIETSAGEIIYFDYEHGIIVDIDPLSGVNVSLGTSQGFQQIGETVDTQSVGGISRTIEGTIVDNSEEVAHGLLTKLSILTSGKLYFNNQYYCDIVVSKTPYLYRNKNGVITFSMMVFSPTPYWYDAEKNDVLIGGWSKDFRFPVMYNVHRFGTRQISVFVNCYNSSPVDIDFEAGFTTAATISHYGLQNMYTYEKLDIEDTLNPSDVVIFKRENGRVTLTKNGDDIFSTLTEDSSLFKLHPGNNAIALLGDDDVKSNIEVVISYREVEVGVI